MNFLYVLFHLKWSASPLKQSGNYTHIYLISFSLERIITGGLLNDQIYPKKYHSPLPKIGGIYDERCASSQLYETGGVKRSKKVQGMRKRHSEELSSLFELLCNASLLQNGVFDVYYPCV